MVGGEDEPRWDGMPPCDEFDVGRWARPAEVGAPTCAYSHRSVARHLRLRYHAVASTSRFRNYPRQMGREVEQTFTRAVSSASKAVLLLISRIRLHPLLRVQPLPYYWLDDTAGPGAHSGQRWLPLSTLSSTPSPTVPIFLSYGEPTPESAQKQAKHIPARRAHNRPLSSSLPPSFPLLCILSALAPSPSVIHVPF